MPILLHLKPLLVYKWYRCDVVVDGGKGGCADDAGGGGGGVGSGCGYFPQYVLL